MDGQEIKLFRGNATCVQVLQELDKRSSENLSHSQANKLEQVLMEFQDIFMSQDSILGQTNVVEHTIDTGETYKTSLTSSSYSSETKSEV